MIRGWPDRGPASPRPVQVRVKCQQEAGLDPVESADGRLALGRALRLWLQDWHAGRNEQLA
jgi:hypothetical protein